MRKNLGNVKKMAVIALAAVMMMSMVACGKKSAVTDNADNTVKTEISAERKEEGFATQETSSVSVVESESIDSGEESTEEYVMEEIPTGVIEEVIRSETATIVNEKNETLPDLSAHVDEIETISFSAESVQPTGEVEYVAGTGNKLYFDEQGNLMFIAMGNPQLQYTAADIEKLGGREKFLHDVLGK